MDVSLRNILSFSLLLVFSSLLLNGCAPRRVYYPREPTGYQRERVPEQQRRESMEKRQTTPTGEEVMRQPEKGLGSGLKPQRGPAQSLYRDAVQAMGRKEYKRAEMLLDRALRLEPGNGWYWHAMGRAKYALGSYEQAIQFCLKSDSLAGQDTELKHSNHLLLHQAQAKVHP